MRTYILLILTLFACNSDRTVRELDDAYLEELAAYRSGIKEEKRVEYLKLAGRYRLEKGDWISFGSDTTRELVIDIDGFPASAGELFVSGDSVLYKPSGDLPVKHEDGSEFTGPRLPLNEYGRSELLSSGRFLWRIMVREGNYFIRIRDEENKAVEAFTGYEWFPPEAEFIFEADFRYFEEPREFEVPSVFDFQETVDFIGQLRFDYQGEAYTLDVTDDGFLMFSDRTAGKETYGAGRYLWVTLPDQDGPVTVDFNYAYNPPCIFSKYTTCTFAPRQNQLPFALTAGEKAAPAGTISKN